MILQYHPDTDMLHI
jgi:uncharacterized protein YuzE